MERRNDGFAAIEDRYAGYTVYDRDGDKIGNVDDVFVDENDQPEYIGVKMGFLGLKSTLIPIDMVRVDEERRTMEVSQEKSVVKDAPAFDDDEESRYARARSRAHEHPQAGPDRARAGARAQEA
ncbi:MAG: PRC-barrel domain-containing protein [Actinobacteria bacterium]|nr:PRC-barrel domain-containing protein [Actinomycetota bacterium]